MENTKIEWCNTIGPHGKSYPGMTFNPWWGCQKVSPACKHCYAATFANRYHPGLWGPAATTPRKIASESYWQQPLKWNTKAAKLNVRLKVFCASMSDVFEDHPGVLDARFRLWELIVATPNLDWLLLTKRPENIISMIPIWWKLVGLPDNIWIGTTVENQECANERIPHLLKVNAKVRFLSMEPLSGPVEFSNVTKRSDAVSQLGKKALNGIDWVIAGGESGHEANPSHPDWFRSLRNQCKAAGVPFFFKQWGEYVALDDANVFHHFQQWVNQAGRWMRGSKCIDTAGNILEIGGHFMHARDNNLFPVYVMHKVGKKKAGRLLDGIEHNDMPV